MKFLLKLALVGAITAVAIRWLRLWSDDAVPTVDPVPGAGANAAEPLRGEDLQVPQTAPH
jgi:hypothetical protein